jgi:hypothetical protein
MRSEERESKKLLVCGAAPIPPEVLIMAKEVGVELVTLDEIRAKKPEELINPIQKLEMYEIKILEPISLNTLSIQNKCKQQPWKKRNKNSRF